MQRTDSKTSNCRLIMSSCIGTLVAEVATLPICTTKTIYQNNKHYTIFDTVKLIYKSGGIRGFFSASTPAIVGQVMSTMSKFTFYEKIKEHRSCCNEDIFNNSINGMLSGLLGGLLTHPFDVWKNTRQMNNSYLEFLKNQKNIFSFINNGLYRGFTGNIGKNIVLYSSLFSLNDFYKSKFDSIVLASILTSLTITTFVQPFDYYKTVTIGGGGLSNIYRGFGLLLARSLPHFTITMTVTNYLINY